MSAGVNTDGLKIQSNNPSYDRWKTKSQMAFRDRCVNGLGITVMAAIGVVLLGVGAKGLYDSSTLLSNLPGGARGAGASGFYTVVAMAGISICGIGAVSGIALFVASVAYAYLVCDWTQYDNEEIAKNLCKAL